MKFERSAVNNCVPQRCNMWFDLEGGDGLDMVGLGSSLSRRRHGDCVVIVGFKAASAHGAAAGERLCDEQPARRGVRYRDKLINSSGLNDILPSIRLLSLSSNYLAK